MAGKVPARLRWYLNRLRAMSPAELAHRLREAGLRQWGRLRPPDPARLVAPGAEEQLPELPGLRAGLARLAAEPGLADRLAGQAAAVARGEILVFGEPWPCPGGVPDWHWDPVGGGRWPEGRYCFDIPFRHGASGGDPKHAWELNRLCWLQPVAAHAFLSGDEAARRLCLDLLSDWLERNPPFRGINWASGIELALRSVSLAVIVTLLDPASLPAELRRRLVLVLAAKGCWLHRFPSLHSSANNHLVAELAGLFLLGSLMPGLRPARAWAAAGRQGLEAEVQRQVLEDGSGAEQSPAYAALSLEWFALAARLGAAQGRPFSAAYLERLARAADWLRAISDGGDQVPDIGDADGTSLFAPELPQAFYPAAVRGVLARVTDRPELAPLRVVPGLRHALFGLPDPGQPTPTGLRSFPGGGMTAMRWTAPRLAAPHGPGLQEALLLLDHGPLGYLSIAAHGHADALSVWLHLDGRPVLADAGTWLYLGAGAWRDHFRSTRAHNTLVVAGTDSSRPSGPFNWASRAQARLLEAGRDGEVWRACAEHDGYLAATGFRHRRTVLRDGAAQIRIRDELAGEGPPVPVEIGFQFAAGLELRAEGADWAVLREGRPVLRLRHDGSLQPRLACGATDPPEGWVSPAFGRRCPAPRLSFAGTMRGNAAQDFILVIG